MTEIYIGFDNGLKGGAVAMDKNGKFLGKCRPKTYTGGWGNQIHPCDYYKFLIEILGPDSEFRSEDDKAFILVEEPLMIVRGGTGPNRRDTNPKAIQSTGVSFGKIIGLVEIMLTTEHIKNVRLQSVPPYDWQKHFWKKGGDTKLKSIKAATDLFPDVDFRISNAGKGPHDGFTDAALIAEYARRHRF